MATAPLLAPPARNSYIRAMSESAPTNTPACPICGKPRDMKYKPFCSKRCADVDLNRWLKGIYAVPVTETDDEDGDQPAGSPEDR